MTETLQQKTERNFRVQSRYDELIREGKHGHYETMFRVVREEVERVNVPAQGAPWQSIETAPKDGTRVLIAEDDVWMAVARYWPCNSYWIEDAASGMKLNPPTHWMPIPAAPCALTSTERK